MLLEKGADVHKASKAERSDCMKPHTRVSVVRLLLAHGAAADLDVKDKDGDTPRTRKAVHCSPAEVDLDSKFPIHAALRTGDVAAMSAPGRRRKVDATKNGTPHSLREQRAAVAGQRRGGRPGEGERC